MDRPAQRGQRLAMLGILNQVLHPPAVDCPLVKLLGWACRTNEQLLGEFIELVGFVEGADGLAILT